MSVIPTLDINQNIVEIKNRVFTNKNLLRNFLEGYIIDGKSINDYITYYLLNVLENEEHSYYTYWIDTGLTWLLWYEKNIGSLTDEEYNSITTGYLKFRYIFNDNNYKNKIRQLYNFTKELSDKINSKLSQDGFGFHTEIILKNIDENLQIIYDTKTLFKEPSFNIRLVIKKNVSGGARKPHRRGRTNPKGTFSYLGREIEKITLEEFVVNPDKFVELGNEIFNNKIILDFNLEYYHSTQARRLDIEEFKNTYLIKKIGDNSYKEGRLKIHNRQKLNRLNELGMMTYCLLNLSTIDDEFGLNVDKYRQYLFFKNCRDKIGFLEEILENYKMFENFKSYNAFFIERVNEEINKFKSPNFELYKDFIDRWFVSMFRPCINSFIVEINRELLETFGVILFIAGGDAMRRYENDISFTKDIDTKLYINNVIIKPAMEEEIRVNRITDIKAYIKDRVVGIIVKHIVKLRNYLEQNIQNIFDNLLQYDLRRQNKGVEILTFKSADNHIFKVDILLDEANKKKFQQFRTRENKKRGDFPVDLYSIDYRTFISEYDENGNLIRNKKSHDISILDVVLQDVDDYYGWYVNDTGGIPVASLDFLLADFYKTYTTDDRALARISSGKVSKDIERYNKIRELFSNRRDRPISYNPERIIISNIDDIKADLLTLRRTFKSDVFNIINEFITKIKDNEAIDLLDVSSLNKIHKDINYQLFLNKYPELKNVIMRLVFLKTNLYNEDLNKLREDYPTFVEDDDEYRQGYYELFSRLCSMNNKDGLVRHVIMFSNPKIKASFNQLQIITKPISTRGKPKPKARATTKRTKK